jgi:light-harvesting protein B-800-850 alpha chain
MNEGRIWTVVSPNVGVPLFLGGVATIAFLVHFAALYNTTWMRKYFEGSAGQATASVTAPALTQPAAATPTQAPAPVVP